MHSFNIRKTGAGFSLLEVIFAFLVFTIGIVAVMALLIVNIRTSAKSPNRLIAATLVDEALTAIQNIRDTNIINGRDWYDGLPLNCKTDGGVGCVLGYNNSCFSGGCPSLLFSNCPGQESQLAQVSNSNRLKIIYNEADPNIGYYQVYGSWACSQIDTIFSRLINITKILIAPSDPNQYKYEVEVTVTWNDGFSHEIKLTSDIYDF